VGVSLLTTRRARTAALLAVVSAWGLLAGATPAHAETVQNGTCDLDLTVTFYGQPTLLGASPGYRIMINSSKSTCDWIPLEPMTTNGSGSAGAGEGGTSLAKCGVLAGIGPWNQTFSAVDPVWDGTHVLAGTWLGATMIVTAHPNGPATKFTSVFALAPADPAEVAGQLQTCAAAGTVTSIHMIGRQVWNDPDLSELLSEVPSP
jgi:hypothetical protein